MIKTILVTGTKGRTSKVTIIDHLLGKDFTKLLVSSDGVFLNKKQIARYEDSLIYFGYSTNVTPGRYTRYNLFHQEYQAKPQSKMPYFKQV